MNVTRQATKARGADIPSVFEIAGLDLLGELFESSNEASFRELLLAICVTVPQRGRRIARKQNCSSGTHLMSPGSAGRSAKVRKGIANSLRMSGRTLDEESSSQLQQ